MSPDVEGSRVASRGYLPRVSTTVSAERVYWDFPASKVSHEYARRVRRGRCAPAALNRDPDQSLLTLGSAVSARCESIRRVDSNLYTSGAVTRRNVGETGNSAAQETEPLRAQRFDLLRRTAVMIGCETAD